MAFGDKRDLIEEEDRDDEDDDGSDGEGEAIKTKMKDQRESTLFEAFKRAYQRKK